MLYRDFKEFIESLNANGVRYLVVGGYALAFHGHPRYTKDLDIWLDRTPENAKRVMQTLKDFGFGSMDLSEADFLRPEFVVQLGYPPCRIDLLTDLSGVDFASSYESRVERETNGVRVSWIGLADLKANKKASGRHQDLADLENLE
jgi:hypothetical protein